MIKCAIIGLLVLNVELLQAHFTIQLISFSVPPDVLRAEIQRQGTLCLDRA